MSPSDPRSVNLLLTIDERNDARQSIAKAEAELQRLLASQEQVKNNISQLKKMLAIHRILPKEIISYIFSILCTEQVSIPHNQDMTPPQITVSHICSEWREIALATPALWNNVEITKPGCDEWVQVVMELFYRAGMRGVNLALNIEKFSPYNTEKAFYDIVLPLHVKKLHLTLPLSALEKLSQNSDDIIANIDEIALSFKCDSNTVPFASNSNQVSITPKFRSKIRSVTILEWDSRRSFVQYMDLQNLPWAQMRHLSCNTYVTLSTIYDILRQIPLLDVCGIKVELDDEAEPPTVLTLPQLRIFHIFVRFKGPQQRDQDRVLRSFKCPNLTDFRFDPPRWTPEMYKIIENHYNLHQLVRFATFGYPYPVSKVLFDAPMLQELVLIEKAFMDKRALEGIGSGELGRCLTSLVFRANFDGESVLKMLVSRQRHMKQVVEASRSWQDQISGIKWIALLNDTVDDYDVYAQLEGELKELGVIVYESAEPMNSHPLSSLNE